MSALCQKRTSGPPTGAREQRWRHGKTERLGGSQVDDKVEFGRLLNRKIGRLGGLRPTRQAAGATVQVLNALQLCRI
jgi:hypothetical protein